MKNTKAMLMLAAVTVSGLAGATKGPDDTGETHATVNLKAQVVNACKFLSPSTTIDAGKYSATDTANSTTAGSLGFQCNAKTEYEFYFSKVNDTTISDKMGGQLAYTLAITGPGVNDGAGPGDAASNEGLASGNTQNVTFLLTIPAGQFSVPSGAYTAMADVELDY